MDLRSGQPFWLMKNGILASYPSLTSDRTCEVVIIGGGITGALIGNGLARESISTILIDKRDVGTGSTAASTAMLLYGTDVELVELAEMIGEQDAVLCYRFGLQAIQTLAELVSDLGVDCGFTKKPSLYLASRQSHVAKLTEEYELRRKHKFVVDFLDADTVNAEYPFGGCAGLLARGDAEIDSLQLTHALLQDARQRGMEIYDRTTVDRIVPNRTGVTLTTDRGHRIKARRAVFATGFESQQYLEQKIGTLHSTFALITEPIEPFPEWPDRCLMWETNRPYYYLRVTEDNRLIVGGGDVPYATAHRQTSLLKSKSRLLGQRLEKWFPDTAIEVAYTWAGTFGSSPDGLARIGKTKEWPHCYFAVGYGGNGITLSTIAAEIIRDDYLGKTHPAADLFRFDR